MKHITNITLNKDMKKLQQVLDAYGTHVDLSQYDFTLESELDEKGSGGLWDLAGDMIESLGTMDVQALVYMLLEPYRKLKGGKK